MSAATNQVHEAFMLVSYEKRLRELLGSMPKEYEPFFLQTDWCWCLMENGEAWWINMKTGTVLQTRV